MPSIKKLFTPTSSVKNPYANRNHPTIIAATTPVAATKFCTPQPPPVRSASPRGSFDYLAEAREAVGRDPVTGRAGASQSAAGRAGGVAERDFVVAEGSRAAASGSGSGGTRTGAGPVLEGPIDRTSAYGNRNEGVTRTHGTQYDLFVQQMKDRKMGVWREPEGGFYAPERRLGEFYAPGDRW